VGVQGGFLLYPQFFKWLILVLNFASSFVSKADGEQEKEKEKERGGTAGSDRSLVC
jgi:hypothetical protein